MPLIIQKPYVALMLRTSAKTYREIQHGVLRYTNLTSPWALLISQNGENAADQARLGLNRLKYSGIIIDETDPMFTDLDQIHGENLQTRVALDEQTVLDYAELYREDETTR